MKLRPADALPCLRKVKKRVKVFLFCWKLLLLQIQNRNEINNENIIVA